MYKKLWANQSGPTHQQLHQVIKSIQKESEHNSEPSTIICEGISEGTLYAQKAGCSVNMKIKPKKSKEEEWECLQRERSEGKLRIERKEKEEGDLGISDGNIILYL